MGSLARQAPPVHRLRAERVGAIEWLFTDEVEVETWGVPLHGRQLRAERFAPTPVRVPTCRYEKWLAGRDLEAALVALHGGARLAPQHKSLLEVVERVLVDDVDGDELLTAEVHKLVLMHPG